MNESEKLQSIIDTLNEIKASNLPKVVDRKHFVDNDEFMKLFNISKRTLQTWRDTGVIAFSQINDKIYYLLTDIDEMLKKHHNKAFKKSKFQK